MKMTKKQAKIILIAGWSIFAAIYAACLFLCILQTQWLLATLLLATVPLIIVEYRRYIRHLKQKK